MIGWVDYDQNRLRLSYIARLPCEYGSTVIDIGHSACLEWAKMGSSVVRRLLGLG